MTDERVFKKQYVKKNGELETYEVSLPQKTINDELSENMKQTREKFKKQSVFTINDNFKEQLENQMGKYFKYITRRNGNIKARMGGVLMKLTDKFLMLLNPNTGVSSMMILLNCSKHQKKKMRICLKVSVLKNR